MSSASLRMSLQRFAADSFLGRRLASRSYIAATEAIAKELAASGIRAAGDRATYFQTLNLFATRIDTGSAIFRVEGLIRATTARDLDDHFRPAVDFVPLENAANRRTAHRVTVPRTWTVYGGKLGTADVIAPGAITGLIVVFDPPNRPDGTPDHQWTQWQGLLAPYRAAAAILLTTLDVTPLSEIDEYIRPHYSLFAPGAIEPSSAPPVLAVSHGLARNLWIGINPKVDPSRRRAASISYEIATHPVRSGARNVVAMVEGTDPGVRGEFVLLHAHADHLGVGNSIPGTDSIFNGADDNGTGVVALMKLAQQFASHRPRRSILFLWTAGGEEEFVGSGWFLAHSPVPTSAIVATINVDMIGRGGLKDGPLGGPDYLEIVGSRGLSTEYGDWVDTVNARLAAPFRISYQRENSADIASRPCGGDDWSFHRAGIPSVLITTGSHPDYHLPSDEADRIDFDKYARVTRFIGDFASYVANAPSRPVRDARVGMRGDCLP